MSNLTSLQTLETYDELISLLNIGVFEGEYTASGVVRTVYDLEKLKAQGLPINEYTISDDGLFLDIVIDNIPYLFLL